ncbi:hypothetical protein SUSAZ_01160 [Sulfolobus acidocaldarius SUSAZ]|nr:hypothetical protein SUSAZ_01160 [Sulfolobus acidocaldarius SUSAZ]
MIAKIDERNNRISDARNERNRNIIPKSPTTGLKYNINVSSNGKGFIY